MTFWKSPDFKALQQDWYKRLEAEGFEDAEKIGKDGDLKLKQYSFRQDGSHKGEYFSLLRDASCSREFKSEPDRIIMTMRADGAQIKDICLALAKHHGTLRPPRFISEYARCRFSVRVIIRRYEQEWGIRKYDEGQLNKKKPDHLARFWKWIEKHTQNPKVKLYKKDQTLPIERFLAV